MPNLITATRCLANLPPLAPRWLWKDRLPRGKIVLLAGPSGSGKTFIALDIAARITTNTPFPTIENCTLKTENSTMQSTAHLVDFSAELAAAANSHDHLIPRSIAPGAAADLRPSGETPGCSSFVDRCSLQRAGSVLLITPEEDLIDNIRPRLEAAHADVDKVTATTDLRIENLKSCTDQMDDLKLIIIDPLSFLVANDNESPYIALKLFDLYQHVFGRSISILALLPMHPGRADPLHRIPGINSLSPYASIIYAASPDHREENTQPNRRVLIQLKNSLIPLAPAMAFNIENSAVAWSQDALPDENVDAIITIPRCKFGPDPIKLDQCIQWLYEFLAPNPRPQNEVVQAAAAAGYSYRTLSRAKAELKIQSKREKEGHWLWRVHPSQFEYDHFDQMTDEVLRLKFPPPV